MKSHIVKRILSFFLVTISILSTASLFTPLVEALDGNTFVAATVTKRTAKKAKKQKVEEEEEEDDDDSGVGAEYAGNKGPSGWVKEGRSWFYYVNGETVGEGCRTINGTVYCFEVDGELMTGEVKRGGKTYYYTEDGTGMLLKNGITPNGQKTDATGMIYEEADGSSTGSTPTFESSTRTSSGSSGTSSSSGSSSGSTPSASYTEKTSSGSSSGSKSGGSSSSGSSTSGSSSGGSSSSSGEEKCIKLAIIRIKGKDCIENSKEAIFEILGMILNIFTFGVGIAATGGFIFCGYQYITSKNEPAVIVKIKTRMFNIVIGLLIYFMFWGLIGLLLPGGLW